MVARLASLALLLLASAGVWFPSSPTAAEPAIAAPAGPLMLIGGRHQDLRSDLRAAFFELAGGKAARIVVIPTAVHDREGPEGADAFLKPWRDLKPQSVVVLHTRDRKTADDPAFVRPLAEATAVFFTNGHRDRIFDAYRGTLVQQELKKLRARGGLIGGTGTGAAVLGDLAIARVSDNRLAEPGLGLLSGFLIEDRSEPEGFRVAVDFNPANVGLMMDPGTAVVIRGPSMRVMGEGTVQVRLAKAADQAERVDTLKAGAQLDLVELRRQAAARAGNGTN